MVTGKEFRISLHQKKKKLRIVSPFSQQSLQPYTKVIPPPRANIFHERNVKTTLFRKYFKRGDLPIARAYEKRTTSKKIVKWTVPPESLDYSYYLPVFFSGLAESILPYKILARSAIKDMLDVGGEKILPTIPQLIIPISNALNTRNHDVIIATLNAIQHLLKTDRKVGITLVPYFRQILPIFNLMRDVNVNIGDKIDFNPIGQVGDKVKETLEMLERFGGNDAYINIKYIVPTYESSVFNSQKH